ncbi:MAG: hypothetical protein VX884_00750 [Pseudomonadota bacterium]|nr:hypothetical protein [Pseudomonadota bacterium]
MNPLFLFGALLFLATLTAENAVLGNDNVADIVSPSFSEISGYVSGEVAFFPKVGLLGVEDRALFSLAAEPEYYLEYEEGATMTLRPFYRFDSADPNRTHGDIRELLFQDSWTDWHLSIGVGKVFWGVVESKHLVDIVNQTDVLEGPNGEAKLGQPMVHLSTNFGSGFLDLFIMPYFRQRDFPSRSGRFRGAVLIDPDKSTYETRLERWHPDVAMRYSASPGNWDLGLAQFYGISREPSLALGINDDGNAVLVPTYEIISQTSLDLQLTSGVWLWKLEGLVRSDQKNVFGVEQNYYSAVAGVEHNMYGFAGTYADLGILVEYMRDSRLRAATDPLNHDIFFGGRLALNDEADSQALVGALQDINSSTRQYFIEASRRITDGVKLTLEAQLFSAVGADDPLQGLKDDDFLRLELAYFY